MKGVWPIIAVSDVPKRAAWYMQLLEARQTHPAGTVFFGTSSAIFPGSVAEE